MFQARCDIGLISILDPPCNGFGSRAEAMLIGAAYIWITSTKPSAQQQSSDTCMGERTNVAVRVLDQRHRPDVVN